MSLIDYTLDESVAVLTMNNGENRFNPDFLDAYLNILDLIESETDAKTLIVTSSHEKIFTNGLDLEWLVPVIQNKDMKTAKEFFFQLNRLFKRFVTYPLIAIAAISGHAFAGGAIFTGAFDFRFMRSDRGYYCIPEVDLGIPFLPGMLALLGKAIPAYKFNEMQFTGMRLTAKECEEHHIVMKALPQDDLMKETLAFAKSLNKKRSIVGEMKNRMNRHIVHALDVEDVPYIESGKFNI
ncbi:MAG: enoyl-CoA hydratase/isomerase family protein [Deltaproteobacteria bacterium]|nr:enoyl-CoA hydratase/isomerase family protein [Deltaproteobacteria bacterium]